MEKKKQQQTSRSLNVQRLVLLLQQERQSLPQRENNYLYIARIQHCAWQN